ncbi:hypothetical protein [Gemmatimonas sp.]|uniref:hypothetical protein n=3 Tax=Gemmatimonas sp. TaxID=1962908 RepID=UPI0035646FE2
MDSSPNRFTHNDLRLCSPKSGCRAAWQLLLLCTIAACNREKTVTISGDIPGLDTLGFLGDSLLAQAERGPAAMFDSLTAMTTATEVAASGTNEGTIANVNGGAGGSDRLATTAGQTMSLRAQARGDSMARAIAQRLASGSDLAGRTRGDSVRGVVTILGAEAARQVVLRADGNNISLSGMATSGLARLAGTEIMVRGVMITPRDIVVSDYVVRASDGVPAWDGTLDENGGLRLTDGSGRKRLPSVPSALRGMVGARIWVAFKDGRTTADSYGVIGRR